MPARMARHCTLFTLSLSKRFCFFEVTISLAFIIASIVGEAYFLYTNKQRIESGRWGDSYIVVSIAINVGLALLLESLVRYFVALY